MTAEGLEPGTADALERARRIHTCCEEYEAQWRDGRRPRIEDVMEQAGGDGHDGLLEELLILDIELRREAGERPAIGEYRSRFPTALERVDAAFVQASTMVSHGENLTVKYRSSMGAIERRPAGPARLGRAGQRDPSTTAPAPLPFERIGDYELIEEIARGGMGVVYKARNAQLKRLVALKMIVSGQMATPVERERFLREAELAANLDHPHIVTIHEVAEYQGCPYFSMQLIEGGSLSQQIKAKNREGSRYQAEAAARLVATLAGAVQYAHEQGFLHCDLKPSNILLDREGRPHITDFGLAKRTSEDSALSLSGTILGTPSYMAPEQASGARKQLGATTDVYGLGAILYELLTGAPPFRMSTVMETVVSVLERDVARPRELRPDVPKELETICLKCLEKSPQDRYASAAALAQELDRYLQGEVIDATTLIPRLRRWNRREPEMVARLLGLGLIALIAQYNYWFESATPSFRLHYTIQGVLALWATSAVIFQLMLRVGWRSDRVRVLWSTADIVFLTVVLKLFEQVDRAAPDSDRIVRFESTLLVGYPLLIAASGLWWRERLVWITTIIAMLAYSWLYVDAALGYRDGHFSWSPSPDLQHPNIFLAALLLTGYVVARQVKRFLLLSQYYEHRPGA